jgi:hypothetical protein
MSRLQTHQHLARDWLLHQNLLFLLLLLLFQKVQQFPAEALKNLPLNCPE